LLSDNQINIWQQRYIISLESALIRRQEQGLRSPNQNLTSQPTNPLRRSVPHSKVFAVSWLWRITLKTNTSHPSQIAHICVPKIYPLLGFYAAFIVTLLKTFRENISAPSLRVKQPKNNVVEVTGCL